MWNQLRTDEYEGMLAETVTMAGNNGDQIHAYLSRPLGKGPFPGIILIPHMPGWDEFCRETAFLCNAAPVPGLRYAMVVVQRIGLLLLKMVTPG